MRKLIQLWIIIAVAFVPAILKSETVNVEIDGIKYNLYDDGTAAVTYFDGDGGYNSTNVSKQYVGELTIPSSTTYEGKEYPVTGIGNHAFINCSGLTSITIPNSVTSIGEYAFFSCTGLTSVTIPESVTSIGDNAFRDCTGLTSVIITDLASWCGINFYGVYSNPLVYAHHLYLNDDEITELVIPSTVTSISKYAFICCTDFTSVTIPSSVTRVGYDAFEKCTGLTSVIITDLASWCGINFDETSSNPLSNAHHLYLNDDEITELVIPSSVMSIGTYAFSGCTALTSVTIPNSLTSIGDGSFCGCSGLTSVTIPNSVTSIGVGSFWDCSGLTSVIIPNSVTSIGGGAFNHCSNLTSVIIPNSVTSIGECAFFECTGLTSVTIGNSVTSIGWGAFFYCTGLTELYVMASTPPVTDNSFGNLDKTNVTLHVPVGSIPAYQTANEWKEFTKIEEWTPAGISSTEAEVPTVAGYNDLNGRRLNAPAKGLNIVRYSDGTTRKVIVK